MRSKHNLGCLKRHDVLLPRHDVRRILNTWLPRSAAALRPTPHQLAQSQEEQNFPEQLQNANAAHLSSLERLPFMHIPNSCLSRQPLKIGQFGATSEERWRRWVKNDGGGACMGWGGIVFNLYCQDNQKEEIWSLTACRDHYRRNVFFSPPKCRLVVTDNGLFFLKKKWN